MLIAVYNELGVARAVYLDGRGSFFGGIFHGFRLSRFVD